MAKQKILPTEKQRLFLKYFQEAGFAYGQAGKCAIRAGYSPKGANANATLVKKNPIIQTAMQEALVRRGLDFDAMAKETKRLALKSMNPFSPKMPDNEVRRKTIEMAGKFYDAFPSQKIDIRKTTARYDMTPQDIKRFDDYKKEEILDAEIIEEDGIEPF